ncbi:hypothetical protein MKW92_016049 [Papaver armeniacum]|nr:hypothetical protein MKW92_016049 [Papaver armeniacum]
MKLAESSRIVVHQESKLVLVKSVRLMVLLITEKLQGIIEVGIFPPMSRLWNLMPAILGEAQELRKDRGKRDGLPVQFEDLFLTCLGKVDSRPSYHDRSRIWPVGYRCSWHDKV